MGILMRSIVDEMPSSISRDFVDFTHVTSDNEDILNLAHEYFSAGANDDGLPGVRSMYQKDWTLQLFFESKDPG
jgi:hypothetical protein